MRRYDGMIRISRQEMQWKGISDGPSALGVQRSRRLAARLQLFSGKLRDPGVVHF
jgi:hypothetical protein